MDIAWLVFLLVIGACAGSFLNVVIYRMPRGASIVFPPSHCPSCGRAIRWYDNIPLVSWLLLRARCRWCGAAISPQYIVVEAAAAVLVAGLYAWYYLLDLRHGAGRFSQTWPMFAAHAALLCGLLACSLVDIKHWIVPLEVCWTVSVIGIASSAASPSPLMRPVSPTSGAMALAAAGGLALSLLLRRYGLIRPSFLDAEGASVKVEPAGGGQTKITSVAITKAHGVNPRKEVLLEVMFLAPAILLAAGAYLLVVRSAPVSQAWAGIVSPSTGAVGRHVNGFLSALHGFMIGGLWIWAARILGTLAFGKEAMGMGDVDIMASVGAATGWVVPSLAFFVAPFFGLLWALVVLTRRNQHELPYGPWLAAATLLVMLFYDQLVEFLRPCAETFSLLV